MSPHPILAQSHDATWPLWILVEGAVGGSYVDHVGGVKTVAKEQGNPTLES